MTTKMITVTDGRNVCGFVLTRQIDGHVARYEAFSADEFSLGLYETQAVAANVCWRHAHNQQSFSASPAQGRDDHSQRETKEN